jgi:hypothetical protein
MGIEDLAEIPIRRTAVKVPGDWVLLTKWIHCLAMEFFI